MRARVAAGVVGLAVGAAAIVVPLVLTGGTRVKTVGASTPSATTAPTTSQIGACGAVGFRPGTLPAGLRAANVDQQAMGVGQSAVVAQGAAGRVDLTRGVTAQAFSVSLYSQPATLFPLGAGAPGPRVPFSHPAGGIPVPCDRFQLEGVGVSGPDLQTVAQGLVATGSS